MSTAELTIELPDELATDTLGRQLATVLLDSTKTNEINELGINSGASVYLSGDLGAGKTALVRALLRAAGVTGRIKSPSYALLESYKVSSLYFYHIDFYRFNDPSEWQDAGFRELFRPDAVVLIEWPEKADGQLPTPDLMISLSYKGEGRVARIEAQTKRGAAWLTTLSEM
ncbi:tRNA (adenosine(37)-N6)-threonylcarbamoyltransferase complex ATPase subunit type 1 TsaE [Orrella daihaiensis]|uniref:tRNA threonylcarbamoyladenosine biosynthesis protein TsaE n=1 Tax=Orrella daihaiensis TaxID=2782176 RepID=A0ABY4AI16_9BURK|nr:tRNA (adenosine(37)-N6)-threonylcarbamoyltransferase complex ATPase subunit type 1 TsaE [Orrella daihaiensis]UOD49937.1 tRNA (adenosine(37)-N6)-threonylcarbamoyltransferase complex ATPase subunit type 1 TsaE [Orrella daihaiensis]